ncbi:2'-5' RNA ligase family protein [Streptomyces sp. HUCO-GS316]|uniref:2'-5' RNA ligase family protein n=1 Tax=Streptomyces sp. HUCO-GS316 TaxID=2692198 RepID=UPI003FA6D2C9
MFATATTAPFDARLEGVHWFGHRDDATVRLDPAAAGEEPWTELHHTLMRRFPRCRGRRAGFTPHLSLGRTTDPNALAAACEARLTPMPVRVGELALLSRRGDEPMRLRGRVALGTGEVRWTEEAPRYGYEAAADTAAADRITRRIEDALSAGVVHVVGSRRMDCALPGADLDLVAARPPPRPVRPLYQSSCAASASTLFRSPTWVSERAGSRVGRAPSARGRGIP